MRFLQAFHALLTRMPQFRTEPERYNGYSIVVPSGYYLIVDSVDYPLEGIDDAYSAYMVEVIGRDVWMKPKSSTPGK